MDLEALWLRRRPTVLFITHSVEEQAPRPRIGDESEPGEVVEQIRVDLPCPGPSFSATPGIRAMWTRFTDISNEWAFHGVDVPCPLKTRSATS
jgi:NitT/TauT family transport system ATP-binding protein